MYEVSSAGVTIELSQNHGSAVSCYNAALGPEIVLYKYNKQGNKHVVARKFNNMRSIASTRIKN